MADSTRAESLAIARVRIGACLVAGTLLALGGRYGLSGWWAKYSGVTLWATCLYLVVLLVKPGLNVRWSMPLTVVLSWGVELAQLTGVPAWLSGKHFMLAWVFGACFSVWDMVAYLVGATLGAGIHFFLGRWGTHGTGFAEQV